MQSLVLLVALLSAVGTRAAVDEKNRPVSKVITLLKDMIAQLEKEGEEDEEIYEAMGCWCETNDKAKTKAIADAESKIAALTSAIEEFTASSARLNTEIANLEKEVAKNSNALDQATALRQKELAEFNAEEKESLQTISSLKSAVIALSKHHEAALLQQESSESIVDFAGTEAMLQHLLRKHADFLAEVLTPSQRRSLKDFARSTSLIQAPASGEIFGILKQMKESFETNLANSQKEEMQSQKDYEDLKSAKEEEISAGQSLIDTKTEELATTDEKNAQSKEDLEDTRASLAADTEFLASLKETCQNVDQEYEERTKTRQLEIQAVSKALAFLSSDEAHDLFTRTFNPTFIQTSSSSSQQRRAMTRLLNKVAVKYNSPELALLAAQAARASSPDNKDDPTFKK